MATRTMPQDIGDWQVMSDNVERLLGELPHLAPQRAELDEIIAEAKRLEAEQEQAIARLREINARRAAVQKRGQAVWRRLAWTLRGYYKATSVKLLEFGIKPLRGGRRSKKARGAKAPGDSAA